MSLPVTKSYYCTTGSYGGSGFAALSETAPNLFSATAFGWNMGQNNPPNYCEMQRGVEVARNAAGLWQAAPTASFPNTVTGNCWAFGPLTGEFLSASWQITMSVRAISRADAQVGQMIYRFWKANNVSGSNASLISPTYFSSSRAIPGTTSAGNGIITPLTSSISLPNINLKDEYFFIQTYWRVITAGGNNADDEDYVFGITASLVKSAPFVTSQARIVVWEQDTI